VFSLTTLARRSPPLALSAGATWGTLGLLSLATPDPARALDVFMLLPLALTPLGIAALHAVQRPHDGKLGRVGSRLAIGATVAVVLGQVGLLADIDALKWLGFPLGALAFLVGLAAFGGATARAGVLPKPLAYALAGSELLAMAVGVALSPISPLSESGDYTGALAHGAVWLAIGLALRARSASSSVGPLRGQAVNAR
jgi:hypothetical protein